MYAYLWITDILQQFRSDEDIVSKLKGGLKGVCVMGTIINVMCAPAPLETSSSRTLPFIFELDDGSAIIKVVYFCSSLKISALSKSNFAMKVNDFCDIRTILQVGKTVEVKGVPQVYTSSVEIKAYEIRQVVDLNNEVDRMFVVDQWRKQCQWFQATPMSNV